MTVAANITLTSFLPLFHTGKVRYTFEIPGYPELLLQVASDRISTHNVVHTSQIPKKGIVLTALTVHWMRSVLHDLANHLHAAGREIYRYLPGEIKLNFPALHQQAIIVRRLNMVPVEFVLRRYLVGAGSLYRDYQRGEDPYGLSLPPELPVMHRFKELVFTPTNKSDRDDPLPADKVRQTYPFETAAFEVAFQRAEHYLKERGLALLDSKAEYDGYTVLGDEIFTPDSSRFAELSAIREGEDPPWLDKELVRKEAMKLWNGGPKIPLTFSDETIAATEAAYEHMLERITGTKLLPWIITNRFDYHR